MSEPEIDTLKKAIREELGCLWSDLHDAQQSGIRTDWSIKCINLAERITDLTKLVGPTPWDEVPLPVLENGVYQRVLASIGITADVDMAKVAEVRASIDERNRRTLAHVERIRQR
jgi:hypothetical protein